MAYTANKHDVFSRRMENWMKTVQALRDEIAKLDEIYVNETASGADDAYTDTAIATEAEHTDAIVFGRAFVDFIENGAVSTLDRTSNITAFTQGD